MTYEEFLEALRKTPRDWHTIRGQIRRGVVDQCPISALDDRPANSWSNVRRLHEIDEELADQIMTAADNLCLDSRDISNVRNDLLKACGLAK